MLVYNEVLHNVLIFKDYKEVCTPSSKYMLLISDYNDYVVINRDLKLI